MTGCSREVVVERRNENSGRDRGRGPFLVSWFLSIGHCLIMGTKGAQIEIMALGKKPPRILSWFRSSFFLSFPPSLPLLALVLVLFLFCSCSFSPLPLLAAHHSWWARCVSPFPPQMRAPL